MPPFYSAFSGVVSVSKRFALNREASRWGTHSKRTVYIFVGSILLHDHVLRYIAGAIIMVVGAIYAVLEFIPSIEPPQNMREADAGWGAEQV